MEPDRAGVNPMIERTVVVWPMPLRPISVTISPAWMSNETPNSAWLRPYAVSTPESCNKVSAIQFHGLLLAEVSAAHLRIGADRVRRSRGDDAPVDENGDAIRQREHRIHVVLD